MDPVTKTVPSPHTDFCSCQDRSDFVAQPYHGGSHLSINWCCLGSFEEKPVVHVVSSMDLYFLNTNEPPQLRQAVASSSFPAATFLLPLHLW